MVRCAKPDLSNTTASPLDDHRRLLRLGRAMFALFGWTTAELLDQGILPLHCEREGCSEPIETWCPLCEKCYCLVHDNLPYGHRCLGNRETFEQAEAIVCTASDPALEQLLRDVLRPAG